MLLSKMPAILAQPRRVKYFPAIEGIMPATTCYFAWGCFPYFSWEREPPRPCGSGRRKCRFIPSSLRNGSAVIAGGAALGAASRRTRPRSANPGQGRWPGYGNSRQDRSALAFGEIQLHADPVGIVEEELRIAGARHDALAEFHVPGLQALAHAFDVGGGKGDVVEPSGILVFLLGAADHDAFARFARAHQMHGRGAARIKPVAGKIERRPVAVLQSQHVAIEILGALQIRGFDGVVL